MPESFKLVLNAWLITSAVTANRSPSLSPASVRLEGPGRGRGRGSGFIQHYDDDTAGYSNDSLGHESVPGPPADNPSNGSSRFRSVGLSGRARARRRRTYYRLLTQSQTQSREAEAADPGPGVTDLARASGSRGTRRSRLEQMGLELDSDDPSYDDGGFPAESARRAQLDTRLGVCHFFVCHRNKTCI